jgi:hypothetical protein
MAYGKSLEPKKKRKGKLWYNPDGTPLKRNVPKEHTTKKARRKAHTENKNVQETIRDEVLSSAIEAAR